MSLSSVQVGEHRVGAGHPCFVIAEVAQAHDGSLGQAHAYIDAVARTGAAAIKFQTHYACEESTPEEPWRVKFSRQDATRYEYWQRMEFSPEQWAGLAAHARDVGLVFLSSPFSVKAVDVLEAIGMPAWKIASGEITNAPLLERVAQTGAPVLLSSGLATWRDLDRAIEILAGKVAHAVFQTTTSYPCPPEKLGLNVLKEMRDRYGCPVGLSDHSATIFAGVAAATLGANLLEVHVVLSKDSFGPDTTSSLTIDELTELVRGVRFVERATSCPQDKGALSETATKLRATFSKSVVAARALERGHTLTLGDLAAKKPGKGIPAARLNELVGKRLTRSLTPDTFLRDEDLV